MTRQEYLERPLIEGVLFEITGDWVRVHCPHAIYIEKHRREVIPFTEVEHLYKQLVEAAKNDPRLKLKGARKFLPALRGLYPQYCEAVHAMNRLFSELVAIAVELRSDGIHSGCRDDELLEEANKKESAMRKFRNRDTAYSRFLDHYNFLQQCLRDKTWADDEGLYTIVLA